MSEQRCMDISGNRQCALLEGHEGAHLFWSHISSPKAEDRDALISSLRAEITKLTLLSDSQLANQERLTEELASVPAQILEVMGSFSDEPISIKDALDFLRQKREGYESWSAQAEAKVIALRAELATERANQERLVGEMQELRQQLTNSLIRPKGSPYAS